MRKREEIEKDPKHYDQLSLEVLLDIRDLLTKQGKMAKPKKLGRPKKNRIS